MPTHSYTYAHKRCPVIMELFIGLGHMIHPPNHKHFISYSEKTAGAAFVLIGHSYCFSCLI